MTDINIKVENIYMLISLQKILHTAKFYEKLDESYTLHASIWSNLIIDRIISYYLEDENSLEYESWNNWRILDENRLEYQVIVDKLIELSKTLESPTKGQIIKIIDIYTSPFTVTKDIFNRLSLIIDNP